MTILILLPRITKNKILMVASLIAFFLPNASTAADSTPAQDTKVNIEKKDDVKDEKKSDEKEIKDNKDTSQTKNIKKLEPIKSSVEDQNSADTTSESSKNSTSSSNQWIAIENADLTFSFTITINSDKSIKTRLILQPFVIEPNGKLREFGKYADQIEEGLNTRFISVPTQIENPLKGNYVVGYLASFQDPVEASVTFSGEVKAALSRPIKDNGEISRKVNVFVTEKPTMNGPNGRDIISVSSDLNIF